MLYQISKEASMKVLFHSTFLSLLLIASSAFAETSPFERYKFDQLQKEGKPILVAVHADWCSTCKKQTPIISKLLKQDKYKGITQLKVDFDTQKDVVRSFKVPMQSTLIVFNGGKEIARSTGETSEAGIEALLSKAL
jgi:thioredoxin 1